MRYIIFLSLFLLPGLVFCQNLPIQKLETLGLTAAEIEATSNLNGENGVNGYFVLARIRVDTPRRGMYFINMAYELYSPKGKTTKLTEFKNTIEQLIHFDILENHVVLVERSPTNKPITVSKFNFKGNLERKIVASRACSYNNNCSWIHEKTKRLALYDEKKNNNGIYNLRNAGYIFEYDWETDETRIVFEGIPLEIDAGTGQNFALTDVIFNEDTKHFEYSQE